MVHGGGSHLNRYHLLWVAPSQLGIKLGCYLVLNWVLDSRAMQQVPAQSCSVHIVSTKRWDWTMYARAMKRLSIMSSSPLRARWPTTLKVDMDKCPFRVLLDLGCKTTSTGFHIFGVLKGVAGDRFDIPHSEKRFRGKITIWRSVMPPRTAIASSGHVGETWSSWGQWYQGAVWGNVWEDLWGSLSQW